MYLNESSSFCSRCQECLVGLFQAPIDHRARILGSPWDEWHIMRDRITDRDELKKTAS
jgi:hypothetical protein